MAKNSISKLAAKGGKARARALTAARRSEIAKQAVETRWRKEGKLKVLPVATHGSSDHPLKIGEIELPCYVLADDRRVLVQREMVAGLSMSQGTAGRGTGDRLAKFIGGKAISPFVSKHLYDVITEPIRFKTTSGNMAYGYEAEVLADLCDAVLSARKDGKLNYQQGHIAERCEILVRGFARVGIVALVDEATGYQDDRARDALAKILEAFVEKELRKWVKTFPSEFYRYLFKLRGLPYNGKCRKPQYMGHLTNDLIYSRLAPGVLAELRKRNPRTSRGTRKSKHHQWLTSEVGNPKLLEHLAAVTALMRGHDAWDSFYVMLERSMPKHQPMPLWEEQGLSAG